MGGAATSLGNLTRLKKKSRSTPKNSSLGSQRDSVMILGGMELLKEQLLNSNTTDDFFGEERTFQAAITRHIDYPTGA